MAQLRLDYQHFVLKNAELIVTGPEDADAFKTYWQQEALPFTGLPDPQHTVANLYGQEVKLLKLGRLPAQVLIDIQGQIRFAHYGSGMQDIPHNDDVLELLDRL
ncbi:thioredoxin peroxidase [candidate division KSB3 bacterium]|uniref:Thioredoxin peroxidase n=1 Tax=candidate division KSB3 bacterium TaxID=2044937 RepID=A0A2G6E319_9BACT|nr:MAG: thioredoxin peroxidase [candidate division KSB3 bacterium]PIE28927.1 MAG: thioredoxin peroxidase [candidate division KSB3 bacterium]